MSDPVPLTLKYLPLWLANIRGKDAETILSALQTLKDAGWSDLRISDSLAVACTRAYADNPCKGYLPKHVRAYYAMARLRELLEEVGSVAPSSELSART